MRLTPRAWYRLRQTLIDAYFSLVLDRPWFVLGAVLTPPDIVSQVLLAGPLTVLYVVGVCVGWLFAPKKKRAEDEQAEGA